MKLIGNKINNLDISGNGFGAPNPRLMTLSQAEYLAFKGKGLANIYCIRDQNLVKLPVIWDTGKGTLSGST